MLLSQSLSQARRNRPSKQVIEQLETRRLLSVVFSADFETPLSAGWTIEGTPTPLWHVSSLRHQSGTKSLYYGRDAQRDYDIGINSGTITTPAISLVGVANPALQLRYLLEVDQLVAEDVWVQISTDASFTTWKTLASGVPNTADGETLLANNVGWRSWSGSLASYVGQTVKLRFYFDSVDGVQNDFEGWFIDDVQISAGDAPPAVLSVSPNDSSVINGSANIQYTFSESVLGVDASDLVLSGPAAAGASVTGVSGSGATWTFAVSGLSSGVLTTTLSGDAGDITDSAAQSLSAVVTKFLVILPDSYDSAAANGTLAAASNLGVVGGTRTLSNLTLHTESDEDFYKFTADADGQVILNLSYVETDTQDVDFYAYNNSQALIVEPDANDDGEEALDNTITFNVVKGQTYYIKAFTEGGGSADTYSITIDAPAEAPRVTGVWVKGSTWNQSYLDFLGANIANSSSSYGYAIPTGSTQTQTLPWSNLNTVSIQFSEQVTLEKTQLVMVGTSTYNVAGSTFLYNLADRVGTWRLPANFIADRLYVKLASSGAFLVEDLAGIDLDGEFTTSTSTFPSGNGTAGGDFVFRFDVLPGDVNGTGTVSISDIASTKSRSGQAITTVTYKSDVNGSNSISIADIAFIKSRSGTPLPPPPASMMASLLFSDELLLS